MTSTTRPTYNHNNSFGAIRYIMAWIVFTAHFNILSGAEVPLPITTPYALKGFFAISGFLLFSTLENRPRTTFSFLWERFLRLIPVYWAVVILGALGLAFFSTMSVADYFLSQQWWKYLFSNILTLNFLEPELPGVFQDGTFHTVNGSLWYVKAELAVTFYTALVFALTHSRGIRRRISVIVSAITFAIVLTLTIWYPEMGIMQKVTYFLSLWLSFIIGSVIYYILPSLMRHPKLMGTACVVIFTEILIMKNWTSNYDPFQSLAVALLVIVAGNVPTKWGKWLSNHTDLSYTFFLCHFPIVQLVIRTPQIVAAGMTVAYFTSLLLTLAISFLFTFTVENRCKKIIAKSRNNYSAGKQ